MELDSFEARIQFLEILKKLTASQASITRACSFALKHRDFYESVHTCLIEELGNISVSQRLNFMFLVDAICQSSQKNAFQGYLDLVARDMEIIIKLVVPLEDLAATLNRGSVQKIFNNWRTRSVFDEETLGKFETLLPNKQILTAQTLSSSGTATSASGEMSKSDILHRMEEDRERHKRSKEDRWHVNYADEGRTEFDAVYDNLSDLDELDYER